MGSEFSLQSVWPFDPKIHLKRYNVDRFVAGWTQSYAEIRIISILETDNVIKSIRAIVAPARVSMGFKITLVLTDLTKCLKGENKSTNSYI